MKGIENWIRIDRDRFVAELKAKGLNAGTLSEEMGYSRAWIKPNEGRIQPSVAAYLEKVYHIDPELYAPQGPTHASETAISVGAVTVERALTKVLDKDATRAWFAGIVKGAVDEYMTENAAGIIAYAFAHSSAVEAMIRDTVADAIKSQIG